MERIILIGATSAIAEQCARLWVADRTLDLVLVGRNLSRLERLAADLRVRSPLSQIQVKETDFLQPAAIQALVTELAAQPIHKVLIAHGSFPDQQACEHDLALCQQALNINALSPVLFAEAFAAHFAITGQGTLAVIGAAAGDRGHKNNYVYGAAKSLLNHYMQGLQHRFAGTAVRILLIKPGPTDTPMSSPLKIQGVSLASVDQVARQIVRAIDKGKRGVLYTPAEGWLKMRIRQHLPTFLFHRLND